MNAYSANSRRTNEVWSTGRSIRYGYDRIGQVTKAVGGWPADDAAYRYDRAGNPVHRRELGLGVTNNFNSLNQIESTTVNVARVTMLGEVNYPMGTVTVGSVQAVLHGTTFEAPNVPVVMGSNVLTAIYEGPGFTNTGHIATATVGVAISNRLYEHDANGNLTNDAVFAYAWDAANQLTNVVRLADDVRVLSMRYDALGRRVEVTRADESIERYVYIPGTFMVLAVLDGDNEVKELYTHGPDLSGTLGGAGGIGGILADFRPQTSDLRALHSDAMGNIVLVSDASGTEAARYRYTPFGREIHREGDYESRYRFSSKEFDPKTGLVYYGYRFYSPQLGRWINRDPIGEYGGLHLYEVAANSLLEYLDPLGAKKCDPFKLAKVISKTLEAIVSFLPVGPSVTFEQPPTTIDPMQQPPQGLPKSWRDANGRVRRSGQPASRRGTAVRGRSGGYRLGGGAFGMSFLLTLEVFSQDHFGCGIDWFDWRKPEADAHCYEYSSGCWKCRCPDGYEWPGGGNHERKIKGDGKPRLSCVHPSLNQRNLFM